MLTRYCLLLVTIAVMFLPMQVLAQETDISGTSRDERLSQEVIGQKIVLSDATETMIVTKCQSAQTKLATIENGSDQIIRDRINIYTYVQEELQAIKLRMMRQGADASEADLLTGQIQQSLNVFTIQANNYGTALDDVVNVNCQQNPEEFEAGLVVMRLNRAKLLDDATNLKNIINNSYNSIFVQLKDRLVS